MGMNPRQKQNPNMKAKNKYDAARSLLKISTSTDLNAWAHHLGVEVSEWPEITLGRIISAERAQGALADRGLGAEIVAQGARDLLRRVGVAAGTYTVWGTL